MSWREKRKRKHDLNEVREDPVPDGDRSAIWIDAQSHPTKFYCCVVLCNDKVYHAAPIVNFMIGWTSQEVFEHCEKKGWNHEWCPAESKL